MHISLHKKRSKNIIASQVSLPQRQQYANNVIFIEHFPKPGTKAEARMIAKDDQNLEETSESDAEEDEEEVKAQTSMGVRASKSKTT